MSTASQEVVKGSVMLSFDSPEGKREFIRKEILRYQMTKTSWSEPFAPAEEDVPLWTAQQEEEFQKLLGMAERRSIQDHVNPSSANTHSKDSSRVHGVICRQAITNSRWWQEGVSLWNPRADMRVELAKAEKVLFHMDTQPTTVKADLGYPVTGRADQVQYQKAKEAFKSLIGDLFSNKVGMTFRKGQVVVKGLGVTLRQAKMNQPLTMVGYTLEDAPFAPGAIQVSIRYQMVLNSPWKKIRGYGLKSTLVPWDVQKFTVEDIEEDFVILHSMSGLKGKPLDLVAFSHEAGGCDVNTREGVIVPKSGKHAGTQFRIDKPDSIVDQWRNATAKTVTIHFDYARAEWEFIKAVDIAEGVWGTPEYDVLQVQEKDQKTVRISARIEILVAEMPLNIEVGLPEEGSGRTQLTPEMLSVLTLQNRIIGEEMNRLGAGKRNSLTKLLKMFKGSAPKGTPSCNIQEEEFLKSIQDLVKDGMNDREVIKAYEHRFPLGAVFNTGGHQSEYSLYLEFTAIQGIATYIGGSGEGVGHSIAEFLRQLPLNLGMLGSESQIHSNFALLVSSVKGWFKVQLESKNLKKKLVSSLKGTAFGSKVRTIALPELHHEGTAPACLPKIAINPKDDILRELAVNPMTGKIPDRFLDSKGKLDPYKMSGEYVTCFRTPMPMQGAVEIVITEKVEVGHLALLMWVWAFFNEGDSDGDSIAIIPAFHYLDNAGIEDPEERKKVMIMMNKHVMGMGGYLLCYDHKSSMTNLPCAEFVSFKDAWTKKKIIVHPGSEAQKVQLKKGILPYARNKAVIDWIETVGDVQDHYRSGVSTSYNIAVTAVNEALDLQYQVWEGHPDLDGRLPKRLLLSLRTCAIAWRLLYEGLGLAGYSEGASRWFQLFSLGSFAVKFQEGPFGPKPLFGNQEGGEQISSALAEGAGFHFRKDSNVIANHLCKISMILADSRAIQDPSKNTKRYEEVVASKTRFSEAVIRRAQRLSSQGEDNVMRQALEAAYDEDFFEDPGNESGQSVIDIFIYEKMWEQLACPWQAKNMKRAAIFMAESTKIIAANSQKEESY